MLTPRLRPPSQPLGVAVYLGCRVGGSAPKWVAVSQGVIYKLLQLCNSGRQHNLSFVQFVIISVTLSVHPAAQTYSTGIRVWRSTVLTLSMASKLHRELVWTTV